MPLLDLKGQRRSYAAPWFAQVAKAKAEEDARSAAVERAGKDKEDKAEQQWPTLSNMETLDDGRIASVRDDIIAAMMTVKFVSARGYHNTNDGGRMYRLGEMLLIS